MKKLSFEERLYREMIKVRQGKRSIAELLDLAYDALDSERLHQLEELLDYVIEVEARSHLPSDINPYNNEVQPSL